SPHVWATWEPDHQQSVRNRCLFAACGGRALRSPISAHNVTLQKAAIAAQSDPGDFNRNESMSGSHAQGFSERRTYSHLALGDVWSGASALRCESMLGPKDRVRAIEDSSHYQLSVVSGLKKVVSGQFVS